jgi:hypothetical protein
LPAAIGDRSASTLIAMAPFGVVRVTVRVWPAGSASGWLVGQSDVADDPPGATEAPALAEAPAPADAPADARRPSRRPAKPTQSPRRRSGGRRG